MTLGDYLKSKGLTQKEFAARIGCAESQISRYLNGLQKPGLDVLIAIERETKGKVPPSAFASAA